MQKFYIDSNGAFIGAFDGVIPENGIEVPTAPNHAHDKWDGNAWVAALIVPKAISTAQGHLALIEFEKYQAAVDFINAIPDATEKLKAEVNFYQRNDWQRDNPTLLGLAQALGIDDSQLDEMFIFGSTK